MLTRAVRFASLASFALAAAMPPRAASAQDSLRVLRFSPASPASLVDPVVVTFDHPVAPRLNASLDPRSVITVRPMSGSTMYWRDPSTLVVELNATWLAAASYTVKLDPALRSANGLALSRRDTVTRRITIRGPQVLFAESVRPDGLLDTLARVRVVMTSQVDEDWTTLVGTLRPDRTCGAAEADTPVQFRLERVRRIERRDGMAIQEAGGLERDRRSDSLRRVMELVADRPLPRGCLGRFEIRGVSATAALYARDLRVKPRFALLPTRCGGVSLCAAGPLMVAFNAPVAASEMRAHVRMDGVTPAISSESFSTTWQVHPGLPPGTTHTLSIASALRSTAGDSLGTTLEMQLVVPHTPPVIAHATGSYVAARSEPTLIGIRHTNTDSVIVIVARVRDTALTGALTHDVWRGGGTWRSVAGDSVVLRYATTAATDTKAVLTVPVSDLPAAWRDASPVAVRAVGVAREVGIVARPAPEVRLVPPYRGRVATGGTPFVVLRRSDIAVHTLDARGEVRVWVTSLREARPLAGARVRLVTGAGREVARAEADARGLAVLRFVPGVATAARAADLLVEARHGGDVNLQPITAKAAYPRPASVVAEGDGEDDDPYAYYADDRWRSLTRSHGAAFTERGIYRPGERVFLKGVVRWFEARTGYTTPRGDTARWVVRWMGADGRGERVWTRRSRLGEFGSVVDTFEVPRTARLGEYTAELRVARDGAWHPVTSTSFEVAEYRVPEFAVRATTDTVAPLFARDTTPVEISAQYLFGVPMQRASVEWWASTTESSPWEVRVRGLEGLSVGRSWWLMPGASDVGRQERGTLQVGDDGRATVRVALGALSRPGRMTFHATVTDANRQTVTSDLSVPVHAADVYVGARWAKRRWVWPAGESIPVEALVVGADGARRSGIPLQLFAIRHAWIDGRSRADTVWRDTRVSTTDTLRAAFTPSAPGQYELLLVARDAGGRQAATGVHAWVTSADSRYAQGNPAGLTLSADKQRYEAGDSAAVRVESNDDGPAWIRLAREGILWEDRVELRRGSNVVMVPIPADASPGADLGVLALRPRTSGDTSNVYYRQATLWLHVGRDGSRLHVIVAPNRFKYQPRDTVRLAVGVKDAAGRGVRSELAVWAVDQGVASLTAMEAPDLLASLLTASVSPYSFATTLAAMLPRLVPESMYGADGSIRIRGISGAAPQRRIPVRMDVPAVGMAELSQNVVTGMAASGPEATLRQLFATTPMYRGAVVTDAMGRARVEFVLPDNLTTFRLVAVAIADGARAGSGDTTVVSTRTLAVRPALPRVIRDGDSLFAGAVVTQDRAGTAPLTLRAEGTGVRIIGASSVADSLDGRGARELRFQLQGVVSTPMRPRRACRSARQGMRARTSSWARSPAPPASASGRTSRWMRCVRGSRCRSAARPCPFSSG